MRARVSASPQFASPLMPSAPRFLKFVDFGLGVKHLDGLEGAVDQARNSVQKSQTKEIPVEEKEHGRARQTEQFSLQPAPPLGLCSEEGPAQLFRTFRLASQYPRFPVGIFVMFPDI